MGILVLICITAVLAMTDIILKYGIEQAVTRKEERTAFGGKLIVRKVYNRGFCMNILDDDPDTVKYISAYSTVILTIVQLLTLLRKKACPLKKIGLSLMTAGAWSNTFDRWLRGYVVDYMAVPSENEKVRKLTFNLADLLLAAGGIFVIIASLFSRGKKEK